MQDPLPRYGGKATKNDDPTGMDWNGVAANDLMRVGVVSQKLIERPVYGPGGC